MERQDYQKWSNNKDKIETFIAKYSDRPLNIQQDANAVLERKLGKTINEDNGYFLHLGLKIIVFLTIFSFLLKRDREPQ